MKKKTKKIENRGGTRPGSGAKPKYREPTKTIAFRIPVSSEAEIRAKVKAIIKQYELSPE